MRRITWSVLLAAALGAAIHGGGAFAQEGEAIPEVADEAQPSATVEPPPPPPMLPPLRPPRTPSRPTEHVVQAGETLHTLALQRQMRVEALASRNRITHARLLFAGQQLELPAPAKPDVMLYRVTPGETIASLAARHHFSPNALRRLNELACAHCLANGQLLRLSAVAQNGEASTPAALPYPLLALTIVPEAPRQGEVVWINVRTASPLQSISGSLGETPLHFIARESQSAPYTYDALTGIGALAPQGLYTLTLRIVDADGEAQVVRGWVRVELAGFGFENLRLSARYAALLDPQTNERELETLAAALASFSEAQHWNGPLSAPVKGRILSYFGARRTFNGGILRTYHSGVDFRTSAGTPVRAAAAGNVVMAQALPIRGNYVLIDHGRGVFTGYAHLSRFNVTPGQFVEAGAVIGYVGSTGRSLGPHLHWELAVGGVLVNPLPWLEYALP